MAIVLPNRRALLATLATLATQIACKRSGSRGSAGAAPASTLAPLSAPSSSSPRPREGLRVVEIAIAGGDWDKRAVVLVPDPPSEPKLPLLVALHGMGETVDPLTGSHGWLDAYDLDVAIARVLDPPLTEDAFRGLVTPEHLREVNDALAEQPYRGLVVCCPYLPRGIGGDVSFDTYARFLGDELLPRVRSQLPVRDDVHATGIDGVSLGGVSALSIGLMRPDLFGAIGTLQAAISMDQADRLADEVQKKIGDRPLRVTTSEEDVYRETLVAFHDKLVARGVPHDFAVVPGPHDYIWNKGPGAMEMLLWNDRVLRR